MNLCQLFSGSIKSAAICTKSIQCFLHSIVLLLSHYTSQVLLIQASREDVSVMKAEQLVNWLQASIILSG